MVHIRTFELMGNTNKNGVIVSADNPFKDDIERMMNMMRSSTKIYNAAGIPTSEEISFTYRKEYLPLTFAKLFKNRELLWDLDPWACKILVHIALELEYNEEKIQLTPHITGIDKRRFSRSMTELMLRRIILKDVKRSWYWVNITLLIVGKINKDEHKSTTPGGKGSNIQTDDSRECKTDIS